MQRDEVEFEGTGGVTLRGWLYRPEGAGPHPVVVMSHGFSAVKEMALPDFAERFCRASFAVLLYDHRNLGASEGDPRLEINPWAQARDTRLALDWISRQPGIDAGRIGLWGTSYSGGIAIVVAACDRRVGAVVANVPLSGYQGVDYADTRARFAGMQEQLLDESGEGLAFEARSRFGPLPVVRLEGIDGPVVLDQEESAEWFGRNGGAAPAWQNSVTLVNAFESDPAWDPGVCIAHVAPTPLLLVVAREDRLASTAVSLAAFERAGQPKQMVVVDGHHFVPYEGEGFERAAGAACRFFERYLG